MAQGIWEDFTDKFGFGDGAGLEDRDFRARDILVRKLNEQPEMKAAGVRAVAFDRPGFHNSCLLLIGTNIAGMPDEEFAAAILRTEEVELPEMAADTNELIAEAYEEAERPDARPPCGHVPADPNADTTACELCGQTIAVNPETHLWQAVSTDPRVPVHEREPVDAPHAAQELQAAIEKFNKALDGDSGDEESDAACAMRDAAQKLLRGISDMVKIAPDLDRDPGMALRVKAVDSTASISRDEDDWWIGSTKAGRTDYCPTPAIAWRQCAILLGLEPGTVRSIDAMGQESGTPAIGNL